MKKIFLILFMLIACNAYAGYDKLISSGNNSLLLNAYDTSSSGNAITGLGTGDVTVKIECIGDAVTTVDETGDTWAEEGSGTYSIITNDTINGNAEDECRAWLEGEGTYAGLIAYAPKMFRYINLRTVTCTISASTSGISFTIGTCVDEDENTITKADNMWVGYLMRAYNTDPATQCNVVGEAVLVDTFTSAGVTGVRVDIPNAGFSATPNTTNCKILIP